MSMNSGFTTGDISALPKITHEELQPRESASRIRTSEAQLHSSARGDLESREWLQPQPLITKVEGAPYPIEALPPVIRAAVEEVAAFVKAPLPLVASSALAAVSLAVQPHVDVKRAEKLFGPVGRSCSQSPIPASENPLATGFF